MYENDRILSPLPDPFRFENGETVKSERAWRRRRSELLERVVETEYGGMPPAPEVFRVQQLHEANYRIFAGTAERQVEFTVHIDLPKPAQEPIPVILTGDGCWRTCTTQVVDEALQRGFAVARFDRTELAADCRKSDRDNGLYLVYPQRRFGAIAAWAWGYSRCMDLIEQLPFLDRENVAISGHSRGGKTVLLAGAVDERFAVVNPNDAGAAGTGSFLYQQVASPEEEQDEKGRCETLADLMRAFPYWLGEKMRPYAGHEERLMFDQHFLKAAIAPRWLLETGALADTWANPRGTVLTAFAAREVFSFLGCGDRLAMRWRTGGHDHRLEDWRALFELLQLRREGRALSAEFQRNPFPEMKLDFDFGAKSVIFQDQAN